MLNVNATVFVSRPLNPTKERNLRNLRIFTSASFVPLREPLSLCDRGSSQLVG